MLGSLFLNNRKRLFTMINDLPTVFEVVTDRKQAKERFSADNSGSKPKLSMKVRTPSHYQKWESKNMLHITR